MTLIIHSNEEKTKRWHIYPRIKYPREEVEKTYKEHLQIFNAMSKEERIKNGFGENGHAHPRRFYIFLWKYIKEIKYFMTEDKKSKYVFPWIIATHSERMNALRQSQVYFDIKQTTLRLAKAKYETYKLKNEITKLEKKVKN